MALIILIAAGPVFAVPVHGGSGPPVAADALPPEGTILAPLPGSWERNFYVYVQARFTDVDGISTSSLYMEVDGAPLSTNWRDSILYATASALPDGPHTVEARASDQLGNGPTVLAWSFNTDTTRPEVEITYPVGNPVVADGSVILSWTGTDDGSGIDRYDLRLDDGPLFDVGNVTTFPFHNLEPGIHYFHVRAVDVAGNYAAYEKIAVATVPPASPPPPNPANTTLVVTLPSDTPAWAIALIAISAVELAAIVALGLRRREPRGGGPRSE